MRQWLSSSIDLDCVLTDTVRIAAGGVDQVQTVPHRLGDYFAAIRLLPDSLANPASFRLVFHKRLEAGRFWKDLMVNILQETEKGPQKASIALDAQGGDGTRGGDALTSEFHRWSGHQSILRSKVSGEREGRPSIGTRSTCRGRCSRASSRAALNLWEEVRRQL